jgi:hypothetical protein
MPVCPQLRAVPMACFPHLKTVVSLTHFMGLAKNVMTQPDGRMPRMSKSPIK